MIEILLTGGSGALGSSIRAVADNSEFEISSPDSKTFDVTDLISCSRYVADKNFDVIVHCAALTNFEHCHSNPLEAFEVNSLGTKNMARLAKDLGIALVYISTEAVFSGSNRSTPYTETDMPATPKNIYGWTKLIGEWWVREILDNFLIVRIGWMFGPSTEKDTKFVTKVSKKIQQKAPRIYAVGDILGSPTYSIHAAGKILDLVKSDTKNIRHVVNTGTATRFDMARELVKLADAKIELTEVTANHFLSEVGRSRYSVLTTNDADAKLPSWKQALGEYIKEISGGQ